MATRSLQPFARQRRGPTAIRARIDLSRFRRHVCTRPPQLSGQKREDATQTRTEQHIRDGRTLKSFPFLFILHPESLPTNATYVQQLPRPRGRKDHPLVRSYLSHRKGKESARKKATARRAAKLLVLVRVGMRVQIHPSSGKSSSRTLYLVFIEGGGGGKWRSLDRSWNQWAVACWWWCWG